MCVVFYYTLGFDNVYEILDCWIEHKLMIKKHYVFMILPLWEPLESCLLSVSSLEIFYKTQNLQDTAWQRSMVKLCWHDPKFILFWSISSWHIALADVFHNKNLQENSVYPLSLFTPWLTSSANTFCVLSSGDSSYTVFTSSLLFHTISWFSSTQIRSYHFAV